jgi:hypothetical protein
MSGRLQRFIASIGPTWIHGRNIGGFLEAVGAALDDGIQACYEGIFASNPLYCEVDALPLISKDRGIRLYETEPEPSKRDRLADWHELRRTFGTHRGELLNLRPYFFGGKIPRMRIVHRSGDAVSCTWHEMSPEGVYSAFRPAFANWIWDASHGAYSRFWVIIYVDGIGPDTAVYGDGTTYGDGSTTYGAHFSTAQIADMIGMIKEAKSAHSTFAGLIFATDPASFDPASAITTLPDGSTNLPDGNWDHIMDPVTGLPTRLGSALFVYEIGAL